jgi:hypothetical protein
MAVRAGPVPAYTGERRFIPGQTENGKMEKRKNGKWNNGIME